MQIENGASYGQREWGYMNLLLPLEGEEAADFYDSSFFVDAIEDTDEKVL